MKLILAAAGFASLITFAEPSLAADFSPATIFSDFTVQGGARYALSSGNTEYNLIAPGVGKVSALHYHSGAANAGELYFRVDHPSHFFLKGVIGDGSLASGKQYDEDFPPTETPYSRATTVKLPGSLDYFNLDLGYDFLDHKHASSPMGAFGYKLGGFVGYSYWHEEFKSVGCSQLATSTICAPGQVAPNALTIKETDLYRGLRVGLVGDLYFGDNWTLSGEAAFLRADHNNQDDHVFTLGITDGAGNGNGVQLESILSYAVTPHFNVGVGGRFSELNTRIGLTDGSGEFEKYDVYRSTVFLQAGYKFH